MWEGRGYWVICALAALLDTPTTEERWLRCLINGGILRVLAIFRHVIAKKMGRQRTSSQSQRERKLHFCIAFRNPPSNHRGDLRLCLLLDKKMKIEKGSSSYIFTMAEQRRDGNISIEISSKHDCNNPETSRVFVLSWTMSAIENALGAAHQRKLIKIKLTNRAIADSPFRARPPPRQLSIGSSITRVRNESLRLHSTPPQ